MLRHKARNTTHQNNKGALSTSSRRLLCNEARSSEDKICQRLATPTRQKAIDEAINLHCEVWRTMILIIDSALRLILVQNDKSDVPADWNSRKSMWAAPKSTGYMHFNLKDN